MSADVLPIGLLLDGRYRFHLTCFQRAYAWRTEHVSRLLTDIFRAMRHQGRKRRYTLGRLMLAQQRDVQDVELVDGHQRLVTLTMLIAVLRDLESDPERASALHRLICDENFAQGDIRHNRLNVQSLPAPLFDKLVRQRGATENDPDHPREDLSETERNILDNRDCIRSELLASSVTEASRRALAQFLLENCFVIVVRVDNQDDAWEIINTEQETQLAFSHADEAKAVILAAMKPEQQVPAARLWEGCESLLCPDDLYRVLSHIRATEWRGRTQSSRPVEAEIVDRFNLGSDALAFMSQRLVPMASMVRDIRQGTIGLEGPQRTAMAQLIEFMTWVDPHTWVPAMLHWLNKRGANDPETLEFVRRLDRLVWMSRIAGIDPGVQETRLLSLLSEIEGGLAPAQSSKLDIEPKLRHEAISNLRSPNFAIKHYAGSLLRRLSILFGNDSGAIQRDHVTIEHILPRNPHVGSEWLKVFRSGEVCRAHYQKLGNVVLISGDENQLAGTRPWLAKRGIYATSNFVLAQNAAVEEEWTVTTINRRTEMLIDTLMSAWMLPPAGKSG